MNEKKINLDSTLEMDRERAKEASFTLLDTFQNGEESESDYKLPLADRQKVTSYYDTYIANLNYSLLLYALSFSVVMILITNFTDSRFEILSSLLTFVYLFSSWNKLSIYGNAYFLNFELLRDLKLKTNEDYSQFKKFTLQIFDSYTVYNSKRFLSSSLIFVVVMALAINVNQNIALLSPFLSLLISPWFVIVNESKRNK